MNQAGIPSSPHQILIVEDDMLLGDVLTEGIQQFHKATWVTEAGEVMNTLRMGDYDLVLLDLMLPNVDGYELLKLIREEYTTDDLSIIIMSAISNADTIVKGFRLGANDYMVKPTELSVIMARINTQLQLQELQREHKRHIAKLERSEQIRKQLNQIASHDLKNPLHNLRIAEGLLREELADNSRLSSLLNTMNVSLDMMEQIVEAFLDMVAIQTDNIQLKPEPILIRDIVNNALTQYELAADNKDIEMVVGDIEGIIRADAGRMAQIAGNLISNAVKYSPKHSKIRIWTSIEADRIRLNVEDKGAGVPKEEQHLLFTEFGRLSTRPTDGEGSTGLGLWIVRHLIELQGGIAGATFPDDGGSIFWIEMPAYNDWR